MAQDDRITASRTRASEAAKRLGRALGSLADALRLLGRSLARWGRDLGRALLALGGPVPLALPPGITPGTWWHLTPSTASTAQRIEFDRYDWLKTRPSPDLFVRGAQINGGYRSAAMQQALLRRTLGTGWSAWGSPAHPHRRVAVSAHDRAVISSKLAAAARQYRERAMPLPYPPGAEMGACWR